jgi:hypothetical protein
MFRRLRRYGGIGCAAGRRTRRSRDPRMPGAATAGVAPALGSADALLGAQFADPDVELYGHQSAREHEPQRSTRSPASEAAPPRDLQQSAIASTHPRASDRRVVTPAGATSPLPRGSGRSPPSHRAQDSADFGPAQSVSFPAPAASHAKRPRATGATSHVAPPARRGPEPRRTRPCESKRVRRGADEADSHAAQAHVSRAKSGSDALRAIESRRTG